LFSAEPENLSGFVSLCEKIRLECWKQAQPDDARWNKNLNFFEDAYRQVSAGLSTILDGYRNNAEACTRARNAAAQCLSSLACGIVLANDLEAAYAVASEALPLASKEEITAEIKVLLGFIESEKHQRPDPGSVSNTLRQRAEQGLASAVKASKAEAKDPILFENLVARRSRRLCVPVTVGLLIVCGICILRGMLRGRVQQSFMSGTDIEVRTSTASLGFETVDPSGQNPAPQTSEESPAMQVAKNGSPVALPNGIDPLERPGANDLGQLTISNGSGQDVAVKLESAISPKRTLRSAYVRAMNEVTISGIPPGEYLLQCATGKDWDPSRKAFQKSQEFSRFENPLSFLEHQNDDNSIEYSVHKVTLRTLPNGNMHKEEITAEEYDDGDREHVE
jgi:hypothetical protein